MKETKTVSAITAALETVERILQKNKLALDDDVRKLSSDAFRDRYEHIGSSADITSFCLGVAMGRWQFVDDINECSVEEPWMPLSQYPPCMTGNERTSAELLVDDASHPKDIVANVRRIMSAFKPDDGDDLEGKVCSNLGVGDLRKYFQSSSKFFSYHFRQYSKSRREAPIYWPISTESGFYTLWFYYHRLTDQTLYKAINDFVDPKLTETGKQLANLPPATAGGGGGGHGKKGKSSHLRPSAELRELVGLVGEIQAYRFLRASFGEDVVTRESWVSEMRSKVIPLVPGEPDNLSDGHGFDFRFRHASKLWHVEVKATTGDDEQFDVSIGEIEVASRLAGDLDSDHIKPASIDH